MRNRNDSLAEKKLLDHFTSGIQESSQRSVGIEIETSFVDDYARPITRKQSQEIFFWLCRYDSWSCTASQGAFKSVLVNPRGDHISYDLGRQNIELSMAPSTEKRVIPTAQEELNKLYRVARQCGAHPFFGPILPTKEDLLVVPDERDATWVRLDGREPLNLLAKTSAVQFTIEVSPADAVIVLNQFGDCLEDFLGEYPQDTLWRKYIKTSAAGYNRLRYGGPVHFVSLEDYCRQLAKQAVVTSGRLVPCNVKNLTDIPLFLRSVWWYFRLRRYKNRLCVEVRPLPRRSDEQLRRQLENVLVVFDGPTLSGHCMGYSFHS